MLCPLTIVKICFMSNEHVIKMTVCIICPCAIEMDEDFCVHKFAPPLEIENWLNISKIVEMPTPKPYIFLFLVSRNI